MGVVIDVDQTLGNLEQRLCSAGIHRDVAEGCVERAFLPQRHAALGVRDARMVGSENDDETGDRYAREDFCGCPAGINVARVWNDDSPSRNSVRMSVCEQSRDYRAQLCGIVRIEPSADGGRPDVHPEEETPGQR